VPSTLRLRNGAVKADLGGAARSVYQAIQPVFTLRLKLGVA